MAERRNPAPRPNHRLAHRTSHELGVRFYLMVFWLPLLLSIAVIVYVGIRTGWR